MKKIAIFLPLVLLGCSASTTEQEQQQQEIAETKDVTADYMRRSIIICADGNQVRFVDYGGRGNATAFTAWTILNPDGTPKRCVRKAQPVQPQQYEEVPE